MPAPANPMDRDDQAELIGKLMDALASELGQLEKNRASQVKMISAPAAWDRADA